MTERDPDLQRFLDAVFASIDERADGPAAAVARRIRSALDHPAPWPSEAKPRRLPVCDELAPALETARHAPGLATVADALAVLDDRLAWTRRAGSEAADSTFYDAHANTLIVGPMGIEARDDVSIGLSLLAPEVRYPDHDNEPEEVYLVLSPGEWRQGDLPWQEPGVGGIVHHEPSVLHAMRSGASPLLAVWCLWMEG